jgi:phage-related protein
MKLAQDIIEKLSEQSELVSTVRYFDVSKSLYALSNIVKAIGDDSFSSELEQKSDALNNIATKSSMLKTQFDKEMSDIGLPELFKKLQTVLSNYESSGGALKLGRKSVNIKDALLNFVKVSQRAKKEE